MKQIGPGILPKSEIYFSSASPKNMKLLYGVLCAGHFYCDSNYHLMRNSYDSILVLHIIKGTLTFRSGNGNFVTAKKNDTVVIDCYEPHEYYTSDFLESAWVHIAGVNSRDLCREITERNSNVIKTKRPEYIKEKIFRIQDGIRDSKIFSETDISAEVYKLLLELLSPFSSKPKAENLHENNIRDVKEYISEHLSEKITVTDLSKKCHMSQTHFSRVFKQHTGYSPYDYVLIMRLSRAKDFLLKTDMSVADIAYETGFNSQANFVCCFTNNEGISPGKFRKLKF